MNYLVFFSILVNLIIYLNINWITKVIKIYDLPDEERKFHKNPISNIGGFIIFVNLLLISIYLIFDHTIIVNERFFPNSRQYISFFIMSLPIFLLGVVDDKINLSANTKLTITIIILTVTLWIDPDLQINTINFSFINESIELKRFSLVFTLFSIIIFINAINMMDGIDLLAGTYLLFLIFLIIIRSDIDNLLILISIGMLNFLYLNYKRKLFLGDNGSIFCSYLVGYLFIKSVNYSQSFYADEIFLAMMIPGIDLVRVAILRVFKRKHPFSADRNHFHHLIMKNYSSSTALICILMLIILPNMLNLIFGLTLIMIIMSILVYFVSIVILYNMTKLN